MQIWSAKFLKMVSPHNSVGWQEWDSNPRHPNDWYLNQRLIPLGHPANIVNTVEGMMFIIVGIVLLQPKQLICNSVAWQEWDSNPRHRHDQCLRWAPEITQPSCQDIEQSWRYVVYYFQIVSWLVKLFISNSVAWQERDTNPRLRHDWYLKPAS